MTSAPPFVHLRVHSEYSLVDGLIQVKPLIKALAAADMPACAMTDQNNLFALVKFYSAAQNAGIKPIIGADIWVADEEPTRLVLLCQNQRGYHNLSILISKGYQHGQTRGVPYLQRAWLETHSEGLIALSGAREGDIGQALLSGNLDLARQRLDFWRRLFPDRFYLELQRTGRPYEEDYLHAAVELALAEDMPVVATNDVRFLKPEDFEAHEVRVCIHSGFTRDDKRRPQAYSAQQYLRSTAEMTELFSDIPEALENTRLIAQRCNLELTLGKNFLPKFPVPEGMTTADYFRVESRQGLEKRLDFLFGADKEKHREAYSARLEIELDVIAAMDFPGYFLIVADFIRWAKANDIPVGPGRGSGAGSLVAYALEITDLDPLQYDLLFERFLNPERVSMPDFDIDFCMDRRDEVIEYVAKKYGREKVSQIITYGSMAAKAVVRDVGRVLGHPYGFVDQIAKLIPFELGITLDKALEDEALKKRYAEDEEVRTLIDMAKKLEGLARNAGKHAGGVVIAPSELTDFAPLYCEEGEENSVVTQFDKNDVEAVGLVKFDFLGLRTLTIIKWALDTINRNADKVLEIERIPLDDVGSFKLLKNAQTTAVFQLESRGMKELTKRLQPDCFEDLIALVALFRPGPLQSGMVDDFINRKHGRAQIEYLHPELQNHQGLIQILKPTYGVIVYQEQVMQIGQFLAGYTLGGADLLRRAMGKKKPEEMAKQRGMFVDGCVSHGIRPETAGYVFDLVEKFAGYGFNKSHSAAYALLAYQTAWLKAHHPAAFMAAVLSADMDNTDKVVTLIDECRAMNLHIQAPHVNRSEYKFTINGEQEVIYGLGAIKGAGEAALQGIVQERAARGLFTDIFNFCQRVDLRKCNRRVLEALLKAGALDGLGPNRGTLAASLDSAIKHAEQHSSHKNQNDMFGLLGDGAAKSDSLPFVQDKPWTPVQKGQGEKEVLGLYLSCHPIAAYLPELAHFSKRIADLKPARNQKIKTAGLIIDIRMVNTRRGKMAILKLDDQSDRIEAALYAEVYNTYQNILEKDAIVVLEGEVTEDTFNGGNHLIVSQVWNLEQARAVHAKRLSLRLEAGKNSDKLVPGLAEVLQKYRATPDGCPIFLEYRKNGVQANLVFGQNWRVRPAEELLGQLKQLLGEQRVEIRY
jgi:DNA polymerase III subunit alpha